MTTPPISLVLGGGAAKWFIHIWVLKALKEKNITVSEIIGTSMGALVGSLHALGWSPDEMVDLARDTRILSLLDIRIGRLHLGGKKLYDWLQSIIARKHFSETSIPITILATELRSGQTHAFKSGSIASALRASVSVPGMSPAKIEWTRYIDGWVVANLWIRYAKYDTIIASSCYGGSPLGRHAGRDQDFSGPVLTGACIRTLLRSQEDLTLELFSHKNILTIRPDISSIAAWKFSDIEHTVDLGYREAMRALDSV